MRINGQALKHYRESKGYSLRELAEATGIALSTLNKWETLAAANPFPSKLKIVSDELGITIDNIALADDVEEFDTSELAFLTYKVFYDDNFVLNKFNDKKSRKYFELKLGEDVVKISGETDFNFGKGWSNTVENKYKGLLNNKNSPKNYIEMYKKQLERCKVLYKSILNVSLMPQTGNLQSAKKGIGNDRLDTYVWALNSFYEGETSLLFNYATCKNMEVLEKYLNLFRKNYDDDPIYNYCSKIYGINKNLVDELILSGKKAINNPGRVMEYMKLAYRFWCQKLGHINKMMNEKKDILSKEEKIIINRELKKVENELENWYDI